jgi:hypothetical protein
MKQAKEESRVGHVLAWIAVILGMATIIWFGAGNTWPF